MNAPQLVVALQTDDKNGRVRHIAHQIAEFRHAQLHVIKLIQTGTKITAAAENAGLSSYTIDIRMGDPRDEVVAAANENESNLIVMGSNNRGAINRLLLGSTARGVLDHTPCDVLICRDHQKQS